MSEDTEHPGPTSPDAAPGVTAESAEPAPPEAPETHAPGASSVGGVAEPALGNGEWPPPPPPDWPITPTAVAPVTVPYAYPPAVGEAGARPPGSEAAPRGPGRFRSWLLVAAVAAVIGGAVGAGVTAIADHNGNSGSTTVVHESSEAPGPAVANGNVTIPQLVDKVSPAVVSIDVKSGQNEDQGTGMIITSDGDVLTNNHVIELFSQNGNSGSITVTEYGQTKGLPATLVGYDQSKDVALLKIDNVSNLPTVTFGNSSKAVVGDAVVAIGNALGLAAGTPTVTHGIVSALGRSVTAGGIGTQTETLTNMIQTDAAINPGNSGGPLIDTAGQVIGMNTAVAGTSSDGTSSQNIGFAIPSATVETLIPQLQKGGQSGNGGAYLGVDITTVTPALRQQYGLTPSSGAVILSVNSGSPAQKAGLAQGDVIVDIGGTAIASADDVTKVIQGAKPGQSVAITYYEGTSKRTTTATLGNQAQALQQTGGGTGGIPGFGNSGGTGNTP
jgi:S1-C subfamily serine protease